jgi:acyl carrier protein
MKKTEFVSKLADFCEFEEKDLKLETQFISINGFNSLAIMAMIAFVDQNFNVKITTKQVQDLTDFNSAISLIGIEKFEDD